MKSNRLMLSKTTTIPTPKPPTPPPTTTMQVFLRRPGHPPAQPARGVPPGKPLVCACLSVSVLYLPEAANRGADKGPDDSRPQK